jgi:hypothetical protein
MYHANDFLTFCVSKRQDFQKTPPFIKRRLPRD